MNKIVHNQSDCPYFLKDLPSHHFLDEDICMIVNIKREEKVKTLMLEYDSLGFLFCGNCQALEYNKKTRFEQ